MWKKEKNHQIEKFMKGDVSSMDFFKAGSDFLTEIIGVHNGSYCPTDYHRS